MARRPSPSAAAVVGAALRLGDDADAVAAELGCCTRTARSHLIANADVIHAMRAKCIAMEPQLIRAVVEAKAATALACAALEKFEEAHSAEIAAALAPAPAVQGRG